MNVHAKIQHKIQHKVTKKQKTFIVDYQRLRCKIHENQYEFTHNWDSSSESFCQFGVFPAHFKYKNMLMF